MAARKPKGVKVSTLTPMNVSALKAARGAGWVEDTVMITSTTATWPAHFTAPQALAQLTDAIIKAKKAGADSRSLHAIRRKLEKLAQAHYAAPERPSPEQPKSTKRMPSGSCYHVEGADLGRGRAKCIDCGLVVDIHAGMHLVPATKPTRAEAAGARALERHKPATPRQGGVTTAQVVPAAPPAAAPQNGTRPAYASVLHGDVYLVVSLGDGIQPGEVVATCSNGSHAHGLVVALNAQGR